MPKSKHTQGIKIPAREMRHCFCCAKALYFIPDPDDEDSLEDMAVVCRYFPGGDKLVEIGTDCEHFKNLRNNQAVTKVMECADCGVKESLQNPFFFHDDTVFLCRSCHQKRHMLKLF